jgi:hypothetical protein
VRCRIEPDVLLLTRERANDGRQQVKDALTPRSIHNDAFAPLVNFGLPTDNQKARV